VGLVPSAFAQDSSLHRSFSASEERRFRIHLTVRSELEGPETVNIGAVTYVKTVQIFAEARLAWTVTESLIALDDSSTAKMREQQEAFSPLLIVRDPDTVDVVADRLAEALRQTLSKWAAGRTVDFRVARDGSATGMPADAAPQLDERPPLLLTPWLVHALRPAAALPHRPVRVGDVWQEPRTVAVAGWTDVHAGETGEWLEAAMPEERAALRLHVTQEISGRVSEAAPATAPRAGESPAHSAGTAEQHPKAALGERTERFFAESLSTIALEDGSVLSASRSARKEIVQVLAPVPGMVEPPRFRATLSVQVEIESCVEGRCDSGGNHR